MVALALVRIPVSSALECPSRIDEAKGAVPKAEAAFEKAKAAARAAARGPLTKAKDMLAHAEVEHKGAGGDVKKHAEAVREARTAQGYAEEARVIAERFEARSNSLVSVEKLPETRDWRRNMGVFGVREAPWAVGRRGKTAAGTRERVSPVVPIPRPACPLRVRKRRPWPVQRGTGAQTLRRAAAAGPGGRQQIGDAQQGVGQHGQPHEHVKPVVPLEQAAPHPAAAQEDGDAALDARTEALPLLERRTPLVRLPLRRPVPVPLGQTDQRDPRLGQAVLIGRTVKAPVPA